MPAESDDKQPKPSQKKMKQSPKSKDPNAHPTDIKHEADERQKDLENKKPSKQESQNSKGEPESD